MTNSNKHLFLDYPYISGESLQIMERKLKNFLEDHKLKKIFDNLIFILKEMVTNANKANLKTIFFRHHQINESNPDAYHSGLEFFKKEMAKSREKYFQLAEQNNCKVTISFSINEEELFVIKITNSRDLLPVEAERIRNKFNNASKIRSIEEMLNQSVDNSEGGGLGITLMILILRGMGIDERSIKFYSGNQETILHIQIPIYLIDTQESKIISDIISQEIQSVPQFPQHIMQLQNMLHDENSQFSDLTKIIEGDPALVADILKTINSVMYALPRNITRIKDAVNYMGYNGIKNLVLTYSTQKILMNHFNLGHIEEIIQHSRETAAYAMAISRLYKKKKIQDDIYTAAILHDIGKIIVESLNPDTVDKLRDLCNERAINPFILERLTEGFNHSLIGWALGKKWNFPLTVIESIRTHHIPQESEEEYFEISAVVHLADFMYYALRENRSFEDLGINIKEYFDLESFEKFLHFKEEMQKIREEYQLIEF